MSNKSFGGHFLSISGYTSSAVFPQYLSTAENYGLPTTSIGDVSFSLRSGCHLFGLEFPYVFPSLGFFEFFSTTFKVSCAFPLCVSQRLDSYFHINDEELFELQVDVHSAEFR